jgi:hypothetical protein
MAPRMLSFAISISPCLDLLQKLLEVLKLGLMSSTLGFF